jgi:hypothetical protein
MRFSWMILSLFLSHQAFAEVRLSLFTDYSTPTLNTSATAQPSLAGATGRWAWGGGLMLGIPLYEESIFLQAGATYVPRTLSDGQTTTTLNFAEIPIQLRFWLTKHIVLGLGGYYAQGLGSARVVGPAGSNSPSFESLGIANSDYGAIASLGIQKHIVKGVAVFLEGLYMRGLKDVGGNAKWSELSGLLGIRFAL